MRTANKIALTAMILVPFALSPALGHADTLTPPAVNAALPATETAAPAPNMALPVPPTPPADAMLQAQRQPTIISMNGTPMNNGDDSLEKTVSNLDDKAVDSAHTITHRLGANAGSLSFEDLNTARQTVARIDAMIEVEKHLGELQKLRNDRSGSAGSLASAIPASALAPPKSAMLVSQQPAPQITAQQSMAMESSWTKDEVTRISGSDGKYTAMLKLSDGTTRHVKTGDEIAHGAKVAWINSSGVGIEEGGKTRTLHVKNVEMVYSTVH
jgi:type IV pilus biogenesis protein PilP